MHTERWLLRAIKITLLMVVVGTPLFYLRQGVYPYTLPKTAFFQAGVEILFALWLYLALLQPHYRPRKNPLLLAGAVFLGVLMLTAVLGIDPPRSFWSTQERALGVVTFMHLGALFVVLASLRRAVPWKTMLYVSFLTSLVVGGLAIAQLFTSNLLLEEVVGGRPGATFGNPTFLAGYLLFHVFLGSYFLILKCREPLLRMRSRLEAALLSVIVFVDTFVLFLAQTRGDLVGLAVGFLVLLVAFSVSPPPLRPRVLRARLFYVTLVLVLVGAAAAFWVTKTNPVWEGVPGVNRFRDISFSDPSLQPRFIALRAAWRGFLDKPLMGWGWDNFNVVFNKYYDPRALEISYQETRFDKPHNAFLEYLVVGGIPLAAAYYGFLLVALWQAWKLKDKLFAAFLTASLAAYIVRNLLVFETIGPLLVLVLLLGFLVYRQQAESGEAEIPSRSIVPSNFHFAGGGILLLGAIVVYIVNILTLQASYLQFWGFKHFVFGRPAQAIASFEKAARIWSPYGWNLKRDYAGTVSEAYFYNPDIVPPEAAWRALRAMEEVAAEHPHDAYNHYALVDMYNQVSSLDPEALLPKAEREAAIALELSPNRQEVYFSLAKTKSLKGDRATALELLKYALDLDPKVPDAHFYYGLLAYDGGNNDLGYREITQAIALGRQWKTHFEPQVVANFFANSGHLKEAIELYETGLRMRPSDLEAKLKLGIAYYFYGDMEQAKKYILEVGKEFDFKTSPSYNELKPIFEALGLSL